MDKRSWENAQEIVAHAIDRQQGEHPRAGNVAVVLALLYVAMAVIAGAEHIAYVMGQDPGRA